MCMVGPPFATMYTLEKKVEEAEILRTAVGFELMVRSSDGH